MEQEIYDLIKQFINNENKAMEYYENNKIGFDNMLKMKRENAENIFMIIKNLHVSEN